MTPTGESCLSSPCSLSMETTIAMTHREWNSHGNSIGKLSSKPLTGDNIK